MAALLAENRAYIDLFSAFWYPYKMEQTPVDLYWDNYKEYVAVLKTNNKEVAAKTGIPYSTLSGWISKRKFPRSNDAVAIANVLGTTVELMHVKHDIKGTVKDQGNRMAINLTHSELKAVSKYWKRASDCMKRNEIPAKELENNILAKRGSYLIYVPNAVVACKMAQALGTTVEHLVFGIDKPSASKRPLLSKKTSD